MLHVLLFFAGMSGSPPVVMRLLASAYSVAEKAGSIVRKVLHSGELGIVEKVRSIYFWRSYNTEELASQNVWKADWVLC